MSPVKPSEFDVGLLTFVPPNKFKPANGGAIIAFKYDGEDGLELKIPAGRVSFDCDFSGKEKDAKSKKLGLSVELPRSPEFEAIRDVLSKADKKFQKYLHDEADNISSALGPKNSTKDKLRTSNNFFGLLRAAKNPKYPDSIAMKWAVSADGESEIPIVDSDKIEVHWKSIKRGSTVEAFVDVKGVWVQEGCVAVLTEAIGLKVKDCGGTAATTKKKMAVADMFEEDTEPAKRKRVAGLSSVEESEDGVESPVGESEDS